MASVQLRAVNKSLIVHLKEIFIRDARSLEGLQRAVKLTKSHLCPTNTTESCLTSMVYKYTYKGYLLRSQGDRGQYFPMIAKVEVTNFALAKLNRGSANLVDRILPGNKPWVHFCDPEINSGALGSVGCKQTHRFSCKLLWRAFLVLRNAGADDVGVWHFSNCHHFAQAPESPEWVRKQRRRLGCLRTLCNRPICWCVLLWMKNNWKAAYLPIKESSSVSLFNELLHCSTTKDTKSWQVVWSIWAEWLTFPGTEYETHTIGMFATFIEAMWHCLFQWSFEYIGKILVKVPQLLNQYCKLVSWCPNFNTCFNVEIISICSAMIRCSRFRNLQFSWKKHLKTTLTFDQSFQMEYMRLVWNILGNVFALSEKFSRRIFEPYHFMFYDWSCWYPE